MNTYVTGATIKCLREAKHLTQAELGDQIGVSCKTVSKWETGHGFPDVSLISKLSSVFGVDISKLLDGKMPEIKPEVGNVKRIKFYVCEKCGNIISSVGNADIVCCGRTLTPLSPKIPDSAHTIDIKTVEYDFYITFPHPMTKEHYISFVAYVCFDRVLTVRLYPEQGGELRFPRMRGGKMYYYCSNHGLFEVEI